MKAASGDSINLRGGWDQLWSALRAASGFEQVLSLATIVGVMLVVVAFIGWLWKRKRSNGFSGAGSDSGGIWIAMIIGAVLAAPGLLFPIVLTIFDVIVNAGISIWNQTA
ncbi:hypothetical protein [Aeromicrobium sp. CTD01-1L150]|uniref:hypothetical protein n=1 Tax=Aeromicrobium sp. CTD01-1L150 TaxID=3341830 RepID=UPI0035C09456